MHGASLPVVPTNSEYLPREMDARQLPPHTTQPGRGTRVIPAPMGRQAPAEAPRRFHSVRRRGGCIHYQRASAVRRDDGSPQEVCGAMVCLISSWARVFPQPMTSWSFGERGSERGLSLSCAGGRSKQMAIYALPAEKRGKRGSATGSGGIAPAATPSASLHPLAGAALFLRLALAGRLQIRRHKHIG